MITGEGFAGVAMPVAVTPGDAGFRAVRSYTWRQEEPIGPSTTRMVLEGDVQVRLGEYVFRAERAAVWVQSLGSGGGGDAAGIYQVFAYLEQAKAPAGAGGVFFEAESLPVQALLASGAPPRLATDLRIDGEPPRRSDALATAEAGEIELRRMLMAAAFPLESPTGPQQAGLASGDAGAEAVVADDGLIGPPVPPASVVAAADAGPSRVPESARPRTPIFRADGVLSFAAGDRVVLAPETTDGENAVFMLGGVGVQYTGDRGALAMEAERGVVFLRSGVGEGALGRLAVEDVIGIYLEGGVSASDGSYTMRGPSIYYDVENNRAMVLDAVFQTYSDTLQSPLYLRAKALKQESADVFRAKNATVANTAFFRPHLSLGASSVTITERPTVFGEMRPFAQASGVTLRGLGVPVGWLPYFQGDPERFPLRGVAFGDTNRTGPVIETDWDFFNLLGVPTPRGLDVEFSLDWYEERGFATGLNATWERERSRGGLLAYTVPDDDGIDVLPNGTERELEDEFRGALIGRHRLQFRPEWTLFAEGTAISDESVLPVFFPLISTASDELTSRLALRRIGDHSVFQVEARATALDFIPNEDRRQSVGYAVDRLPTIEFSQLATDLLGPSLPGVLTHTFDVRFDAMRMRFSEVPVRDLGLTGTAQSEQLFGAQPDQSIGDVLRSQGLNEELVNRFDTRQELTLNFDVGPIAVTPFAVGRLTAYDTDFSEFNQGEADQVRLWGAAGVRVATSIQRVYNGVESRTLDLHRLRHIIEPSATLWTADTTVDREDLPVFDDDVEGLTDGTTARFSIDQTFQTKRGGPGRWRDVDLLTLRASYVTTENDVSIDTDIGRFFDARPELGAPGEFFDFRAVWQASEVVALVGDMVFDIDENETDRGSIGAIISHDDRLSTTVEFRFLENQDAPFLSAIAQYRPSQKYMIEFGTRYDFNINDVADLRSTFLRSFPQGQLGVSITFNNINDTTSFGFQIRPGQLGRGFNVGGIGAVEGSQGGF